MHVAPLIEHVHSRGELGHALLAVALKLELLVAAQVEHVLDDADVALGREPRTDHQDVAEVLRALLGPTLTSGPAAAGLGVLLLGTTFLGLVIYHIARLACGRFTTAAITAITGAFGAGSSLGSGRLLLLAGLGLSSVDFGACSLSLSGC